MSVRRHILLLDRWVYHRQDRIRRPINNRLITLIALLLVCFAGMTARTWQVTVLQGVEPSSAVTLPRGEHARADIVDRNGRLLATDLKVSDLQAVPHNPGTDPFHQSLRAGQIAGELVRIIPEAHHDQLVRKLMRPQRFSVLHRKLTPEQKWQVNALGYPWLTFRNSTARIYPNGELSAHILGYVDIDNTGIAGLEHGLNHRLTHRQDPLVLSIDIRIQHALAQSLREAVLQTGATHAAGLVLDARTRHVRALFSWPSFDPHHPGQAHDVALFNRAALGIYELGSVFKIINTALHAEHILGSSQKIYDARQPLRIANFTIKDYHAQNRKLSVPEIFIHSSNIGSARMALEVGAQAQQSLLHNLGLLRKLNTQIPELGTPHYPQVWRRVNTMTIAFGHGIAVSPLHMTAAVAALVDDGVMRDPSFLEHTLPQGGQRVASLETVEWVRHLMRRNVVEGSGAKANIPGMAVGGKTGTANKLGSDGQYRDDELLSSFIAIAPADAPRYVIYVLLDAPQRVPGTSVLRPTGGQVAAPVAGAIIRALGNLNLLSPQHPPRHPEIAAHSR